MASHILTAENAENAEKTQKELNLFGDGQVELYP
jgi:hypothetical protein